MDAVQFALSLQRLELVCGGADTDPSATVSSALGHCAALIERGDPEGALSDQVRNSNNNNNGAWHAGNCSHTLQLVQPCFAVVTLVRCRCCVWLLCVVVCCCWWVCMTCQSMPWLLFACTYVNTPNSMNRIHPHANPLHHPVNPHPVNPPPITPADILAADLCRPPARPSNLPKAPVRCARAQRHAHT